MPYLDLREPFNAWSHVIGAIAALPVTWLLLRRAAGSAGPPSYRRGKLVCLAVFGLGMGICYSLSALYHGAEIRGADHLRQLQRLDHVGIFLLIAGTFTPMAWSLMRPRSMRIGLVAVWSTTVVCATIMWAWDPTPTWLATSIYLGLGWGMVFAYLDVQSHYGPRALRPLLAGAIFYSVGALINMFKTPAFNPGIPFGHEIFHVFDLAGTAAHAYFLWSVAAPASPRPAKASFLEKAARPARAHTTPARTPISTLTVPGRDA